MSARVSIPRYVKSKVFPCAWCGAPDARGESHAQGCPRVAPVSKAARLAIALACEDGWRERALGRRLATNLTRPSYRAIPGARDANVNEAMRAGV